MLLSFELHFLQFYQSKKKKKPAYETYETRSCKHMKPEGIEEKKKKISC